MRIEEEIEKMINTLYALMLETDNNVEKLTRLSMACALDWVLGGPQIRI
jgi:hypothetical protein